jgi:Fur family transcriptional regulator, stress-responsive regulator
MTSNQLLRERGLRATAHRLAVLDTLADHPHGTAADITDRLGGGRRADRLSKQGLYNVLDDLTRAGVLRRIEPAGSAARYELRVGDNHHHMVCRECGVVADVDCATGAAPCLDPSQLEPGFVVDEAEVVWWGTCSECARSDALPTEVHDVITTTLSSKGEPQ